MPRPSCCRRIQGLPISPTFGPTGRPAASCREIVLLLDEFEAMRLADLDGLYQEEAAKRMGVSRPTFGRILDSAHHKIAQVLVGGNRLRIEGGEVCTDLLSRFACTECCHRWSADPVAAAPRHCPKCDSDSIQIACSAKRPGRKDCPKSRRPVPAPCVVKSPKVPRSSLSRCRAKGSGS